MADHTNYTVPTPVGFADTLQSGRIGSGAFAVEIDFAKFGGVLNNKYIDLGKLPGGMYILQSAVVVAEPLEVVDSSGASDTLNSATFTSYADGASSTSLGACAISNNVPGKTAFATAVTVTVDPLQDTTLKVNVAINHGSNATNGKLVGGKVLIIVYARYSPSLTEIKNLYPGKDETYAKVGD